MLLILRIIKFTLQDIFRNFSLSAMTVLILVLMLLSINTLVIVQVLTQQATSSVKDQIDVSVFMRPEATEDQIKSVKQYLQSFPTVVDLAYFTREEVLSQFQEDHADNPDIMASLQELGNNPLGATFVIKTREPSDYKQIVDGLSSPELSAGIEGKTFANTEDAINRIHVITTRVEQFSIILSGLFALIAFLIIFNTIRIAIYTQRIEIGIKRLVGATNWFIRGPYLFEAFIFSVLSVALTAVVVYGANQLLDPYIVAVFGSSTFLTSYFSSHILLLFGGQFAAALFLTFFSSWLAMRRYLKV